MTDVQATLENNVKSGSLSGADQRSRGVVVSGVPQASRPPNCQD
jgi:hypothetical protein